MRDVDAAPDENGPGEPAFAGHPCRYYSQTFPADDLGDLLRTIADTADVIPGFELLDIIVRWGPEVDEVTATVYFVLASGGG